MNKEDLLYYYFSNSLNAEQELLFNKLLEEDEAFKQQFEYESNLKRAIKEKRHLDLKQKLKGFETNIEKPKKPKRKISYLSLAASVVLLISAGWFGYQSLFGFNSSKLYQENFKAYPNTVYTITRSDSINSLEREAFVAYESEAYQLAIDKFNQADSKDYFTFYKAQSFLNLGNTTKAKELFQQIIKQNKKFVAESYWYLSLSYLKENDKTNALNNLKKLVSDFNYKKNEAQKLIKELD